MENARHGYLVGIGPGSHNSGIALIQASKENGIQLLNNHEEERFSGEKHAIEYPEQSVELLKQQMKEMDISH